MKKPKKVKIAYSISQDAIEMLDEKAKKDKMKKIDVLEKALYLFCKKTIDQIQK